MVGLELCTDVEISVLAAENEIPPPAKDYQSVSSLASSFWMLNDLDRALAEIVH